MILPSRKLHETKDDYGLSEHGVACSLAGPRGRSDSAARVGFASMEYNSAQQKGRAKNVKAAEEIAFKAL